MGKKGGRGRQAAAGRWQAKAGGRAAAAARERERERERDRLARESPKAGEGREKKKNGRRKWAHESPFGGLLCPKEPIGSKAKHGKGVAICGQAQVDNISHTAAFPPTFTNLGDLT